MYTPTVQSMYFAYAHQLHAAKTVINTRKREQRVPGSFFPPPTKSLGTRLVCLSQHNIVTVPYSSTVS